MHYENVQMQMVVMTPARWRTMRMQPEQYVMVQYYNDKHAIVYFGGVGYNIGNRIVYSAGAKYYVMKHISTSVVVYQSFMNHVVVGLNVEI